LGVSREVPAGGGGDGGLVQIEPSQRTAFRRFADAVHAFSNDPNRTNFARYLAASRAFEESPSGVPATRSPREPNRGLNRR
jgi:hypothetical protein